MAKKRTKKTVKRVPKKKKEDQYHIGIANPADLRRDILEPNREILQFLQSYEQFKEVMKEKKQAMATLKEDVHQIRLDFNRLRRMFPLDKVRAESTYLEIRKDLQAESKIVSPKVVVRPKPELNSLENELSDIESKLESLK